MEPWLNNLVQVLSERQKEDAAVNMIFRDAAGSPEKQIQDIQSLMDNGIDLLIISPDGSGSLDKTLEQVREKIPVVMVGVGSEKDCYTSLIQADDEKIGRLAGEYILEHLYEEGDRIVVIEGVKGSPISEKRHRGILDATIQSPDFGSMAYDAALALLYGEEADHNLTIEPQLITENK